MAENGRDNDFNVVLKFGTVTLTLVLSDGNELHPGDETKWVYAWTLYVA